MAGLGRSLPGCRQRQSGLRQPHRKPAPPPDSWPQGVDRSRPVAPPRAPSASHGCRAWWFKSITDIPVVVNALLGEGAARVRLLRSTDRWFGVTYPEDKPNTEREIAEMVRRGGYPSPIWRNG